MRETSELRQVLDWSAALWAGIFAGIIFFLVNLFVVTSFVGGNVWVMVRLLASIPLGQDVLAPPATFDFGVLVSAVITHFSLSIMFSLLLAFVIHRWGLIVGVLGGALFGLALYLINLYTLTYFFPWFFVLRGWPLVLSHVVFGAAAGGIYEALEVEEFVLVENDKEGSNYD